MKRVLIAEPGTGEVLAGAAFDTDHGRLMFHVCQGVNCPGIVIGQTSKIHGNLQATVIHYTPAEALVIGQALVELAKAGLT